MELVKGIPLTQFCDEHKLPVLDRLNLFMQGVERNLFRLGAGRNGMNSVLQSLLGGAARAPEGDHPPRPEADQHPGPKPRSRRAGSAEGDRLRAGQGDERHALIVRVGPRPVQTLKRQ